MAFITYRPVYCGSLPVVQDLFPCPSFTGYGIAGNRVINRLPCTSRACRITASRFGLEHTGSYALCCHHSQILQQENPQNYPEGKSRVGETSLVLEPMAGKATRCFRC